MDPEKDLKDQVDKTPEGEAPEKAYDEAWDEADKESDPANPDAMASKDGKEGLPDVEKDEQAPEQKPPVSPEGSQEPSRSKDYGSIEAMEKAVKDSRAFAMTLQNKVNELQSKVKAFEEGKASQQDVDAARKSVQDAKDNYDEVKSKVYEDYPELKALLDPLIETNRSLQKEVSNLKETKKQDTEADERRKVKEHFESYVKPAVLKVHEDFESILTRKTNDGKTVLNEEFFNWAKEQRPALRMAAMDSNDPEDIIWAVTEYKKSNAAGDIQALKEREEAKRKSKQTNAQSLRGGYTPVPAGKKGGDPADYDAGWDEAGEHLKREGVA